MGRGRPIVIVEDSDLDFELMERALKKRYPKQVLIRVTSGEELLDWLWCSGRHAGRDINVYPAVVILDERLPGVNGLTILQFMRNGQRLTNVPVIMFSAVSDDAFVERAYASGVNSYVIKEGTFDRLIETMENIVKYWSNYNYATNRS